MSVLAALFTSLRTVFDVFIDATTFLALCLRPRAALAAEILFLRKQLGLYVERQKRPRRTTRSMRFTLAHLARWFDWRDVLTYRQAQYVDPLASKGIPTVLEVEVSGEWPASGSGRSPEVDCRDGNEQSDLGGGADRK